MQVLGQLAAREASLAKEIAVHEDQRAHPGSVDSHQLLAGSAADIEGLHFNGIPLGGEFL